MANFDKLPSRAKRAAFAAMDRGKGKATGGKPGGSSGTKTSSSAAAGSRTAEQRVGTLNRGRGTAPTDNGGRISREAAAEIMFGTRGAAARIRKANAKRRLSK